MVGGVSQWPVHTMRSRSRAVTEHAPARLLVRWPPGSGADGDQYDPKSELRAKARSMPFMAYTGRPPSAPDPRTRLSARGDDRNEVGRTAGSVIDARRGGLSGRHDRPSGRHGRSAAGQVAPPGR